MAFDKVVDSSKLNAAMTATADKIRAEAKTSNPIEWDESNGFADSIITQTKTATPSTNLQAIRPDAGYVGLSQVNVEAIQPITQATPSISVSSGGLITASATQTAGYVAAGTKSATKQLSTQAAKTVTPTTSDQTAVASGKYTTGAVTVKGDANLIPENILSGISIFGVAGTHISPQIATGRVYISETTRDFPIVVEGIGFMPVRVICYSASVSRSIYASIYLLDCSSDESSTSFAISTRSSGGSTTQDSSVSAAGLITFSEDGFTIGEGYSLRTKFLTGYMYYIAIG